MSFPDPPPDPGPDPNAPAWGATVTIPGSVTRRLIYGSVYLGGGAASIEQVHCEVKASGSQEWKNKQSLMVQQLTANRLPYAFLAHGGDQYRFRVVVTGPDGAHQHEHYQVEDF